MRANQFIVLLSGLFLTSCGSDELTRDKAEAMLVEYYDYPNLAYLELRSDFYCWGLSKENKSIIDARLVEDKRFFSSNDNCWHTQLRAKRKYMKYVIKTMASGLQNTNKVTQYICSERKFKEITGIKFNDAKTKATVEYTTILFDITPFGKAFGYNEGSKAYSSEFELYDNGWRIVDENYENFKRVNYPYK